MDTSKQAQQSYDAMVKKASPNSPILSNCIKAFVSGGLICVLGQALLMLYTKKGISEADAALWVSITLIGISAVLTAFGLYEKLGKFCGAGTIVPITGFANSVVSPAMEFRREGLVMGVGAKMFTLAGPVLVYGIGSPLFPLRLSSKRRGWCSAWRRKCLLSQALSLFTAR